MERHNLILSARSGSETDALLSFLGSEPAWKVVCKPPEELRTGTVSHALCIFSDPDEQLISRLLQNPSPFSGGALLLGRFTDALREACSAAGVPVLEKPVSLPLLRSAIDLVLAGSAKMRQLTDENRRLQQELRQVKLISRAKYALMQYLGMSEAEAHQYIQKQAMETSVPKAVVAEEILSAYVL